MIRPKRIAEGLLKAAVNMNTTISDNRLKTCKGCEFGQGVSCDVCGCILKAKTKVLQESCPLSKWDDIKIVPDKNVAIRLHEVGKATITLENGFVTVTHNRPYKKGEPTENALITLDLINLRGDDENRHSKDIPLTNIWLKHCGCYESRINGKAYNNEKKTYNLLDDSQHVTITLRYNTELDPKSYSMTKDIKIITDQGTISLKIKGEVE